MGNIYLTGFMAAGKSSLGDILSRSLNLDFVDLDSLMEEKTGFSITEIFARQGEAKFRRLEMSALQEVSSRHGLVVATGGGAILTPQNRSLMKRTGLVIGLGVSLQEAVRRAESDQGTDKRPLLSSAASVYTERDQLYRDADLFIDTTCLAPSEVAQRAIAYIKESFSLCPVNVTTAGGNYNVLIKPTALGDLGQHLKNLGAHKKVIVFSDTNVWHLYKDALISSLGMGKLRCLNWNVTPLEKWKSLSSAQAAYDYLVDAGITRDTFCVAFGGGLIGDLGGFIAATYMRGIPFVQVPTSLLAQVDASIGGKVAVNHAKGKNLIGTFYQPSLCLIDPLLLRSLPAQNFKEGLAEVIKYALLTGGEFLSTLATKQAQITKRDPLTLSDVIHRCCRTKAKYVMDDERDLGVRRHLNLGHTLAHALETLTEYNKLRHGEAVAIGLVWAACVSETMGIAESGFTDYVKNILSAYGLPQTFPPTTGYAPKREDILKTMLLDKKASLASLNCVLVSKPGEVQIAENVGKLALTAGLSAVGL